MVWFGLVLLQVVTFDWQAEPASFARSPIPPRPATHSFRRLTRVDESLPHDWRVADSDVTDSRSPATGSESPPQRTSSAANFLCSELPLQRTSAARFAADRFHCGSLSTVPGDSAIHSATPCEQRQRRLPLGDRLGQPFARAARHSLRNTRQLWLGEQDY